MVEVVAGDAPVGLVEGERRRAGTVLGPVMGAEHRLELLGHPDRHHPSTVGALGAGQMRAHHVGLAGVLGEAHHRDVLAFGEAGDRRAEPVTDLLEDRRGRDLVAQVRGQERHDLPADLQVGDVGVQVDAVQTLDVERDVPVEDVVDVCKSRP